MLGDLSIEGENSALTDHVGKETRNELAEMFLTVASLAMFLCDW